MAALAITLMAHPAHAQDNSNPAAFARPGAPGCGLSVQASEPRVRWINGEYTETHIDLRVQVPAETTADALNKAPRCA